MESSAETVEKQTLSAISRSAVVILSKQLNHHLLLYFDTSELILILTTMHTLLGTIRNVPGFTMSFFTIKELIQSITIQALANYASSPSVYTSIFNLILLVIILECLPAIKGWLGKDLESFKTNVTYIFADLIGKFLMKIEAPLFGAALGICLKGEGLLGQTLAFTGINTLNSVVFDSIKGGELSIAWPILLLYFAFQLCSSFDGWEELFDFGLYRASDAAYEKIMSSYRVTPTTLAIAFIFLVILLPKDRVGTGVCILIIVQALSEWFLKGIEFISQSDPVLAGLAVITVVHFLTISIENFYYKNKI